MRGKAMTGERAPLQPAGPGALYSAGHKFSAKGTLNNSSNGILVFRLHELKGLSTTNLVLAVFTLLYLGVQVALFTLNALDKNDDDCGDPDLGPSVARCGTPMSDLQFHLMEFWAQFVYACTEAASLVSSPRAVSSISQSPLLLRVLLLFDIVATFVPAILVSVNLAFFEVAAHEIEYVNEFTLAFVNLVLLDSLMRRAGRDTPKRAGRTVALCACAAPVLQLAIYNSPLEKAEQISHVFEFLFGAVNAVVTFWFCLDNWSAAEEEIHCIKYSKYVECVDCATTHSMTAQSFGKSGHSQPQTSLNARARGDVELGGVV